jgi:Na+-driven multidrug efflux pump
MILSGIQIALHMTLNFLLIFPTRSMSPLGLFSFTMPGAGMGLAGAATALAVSAWVSAIAYLVYSKHTELGDCLQFVIIRMSWAVRILRIASPAAANGIIRVFSMAVFTIILKYTAEGSSAIAAMALGFSIESIMFMPSFGISAAAAALVGQSLGMKKPHRAERLGWISAHMAGIITLVLCIPLAIFAYPIAGVMSPGKDAIIYQTGMLIQWVCLTEVAFAYFGVMVGSMQGAGDTVAPFWITVLTLWVLRVPLALCLALKTLRIAFDVTWNLPFNLAPIHLAMDTGPLVVGIGLGALGAWIAMSISQLAQGAMAISLFKSGKWKLRKV